METLIHDSLSAAPVLGVTLLSLIVLLIHALKKDSENIQFWVSIIGLLGCIGLAIWKFPNPALAFSDSILVGGYANVFDIIFLSATILTFLLSKDYIRKEGVNFGEYYALMLFALLGMMCLASAVDLIVTFIGLELMSVSLYVLAGFTRKVPTSNEAALKYFLLGAFATGFFLYGIALIYGATGTTNISHVVMNTLNVAGSGMFYVGCGLLFVGFAFKVAAVPFHMWVPDVYEGSPTSVSAFMSTSAKSAAFGSLTLLFIVSFRFVGTEINTAVAILSAASMIVGNVVAIAQTNIKRMLAYSSVAHAGYILIAIAAGAMESIQGIIFYLIAYTLTNLGAFGIVSVLESETQTNLSIDDYNGLGHRKPILAVLMSIFMFSLTGIPPFAGFFGKYYIFYAAIQQGYTWLVIIGVLTSVISAYFYLRLVVVMYFKDSIVDTPVLVSRYSLASHVISAVGVILFGILPSLILDLIQHLF